MSHGWTPGSGLAGSCGDFDLWRTCRPCVPASRVRGPRLPHVLSDTRRRPVPAVPVGAKWCPVVVLGCISLMTGGAEHLSVGLRGRLYVFFGETSPHILCSFLNGVICLFVGLREFFVYSGYKSLIGFVS